VTVSAPAPVSIDVVPGIVLTTLSVSLPEPSLTVERADARERNAASTHAEAGRLDAPSVPVFAEELPESSIVKLSLPPPKTLTAPATLSTTPPKRGPCCQS